MGECYICTLETDKLSNCKCKNLVLHEECQLKIIMANNNCMKCKVCNTDFTNVELKTIETRRLNCRFWINKEMLIKFIEVIGLFGVGASGLYCLTQLPFMQIVSFFIFGVSSSFIAVGWVFTYTLCFRIIDELSKGLYIVDKTEVLKIKNEEGINRIIELV